MILRYLLKKRSVTQFVNYCFDNLLPPVIRDSVFFDWFLKVLLGSNNPLFGFKKRVVSMSMKEFSDTYKQIMHLYTRETDLNSRCIEHILARSVGPRVLEVGAGSGFLARQLSERFTTTVTELEPGEKLTSLPDLEIVKAQCEALPFLGGSFDTVICTHVLEHVLDFDKAVAELRRLARTRLIIVVPLQRPYRTTPDLHIHFFPYPELFLIRARPAYPHTTRILQGDLYYQEQRTPESFFCNKKTIS